MTSQEINKLIGVSESYKAPDRMMEIVLMTDTAQRNAIYSSFMTAFGYDDSYEWFNDYFEDEHADRKGKKQDFTPKSIGKTLSGIIGSQKGIMYEPAAGNGSLIISKWNDDRLACDPFEYLPSDHVYVCCELSDRSVPFLLFNMAIRGMMGVVYHGNALTGKYKEAYTVVNDANSPVSFSSVYKLSDERPDLFN